MGAARGTGPVDCKAASSGPRHWHQRGEQVGPDTQDSPSRRPEVQHLVYGTVGTVPTVRYLGYGTVGRYLVYRT